MIYLRQVKFDFHFSANFGGLFAGIMSLFQKYGDLSYQGKWKLS